MFRPVFAKSRARSKGPFRSRQQPLEARPTAAAGMVAELEAAGAPLEAAPSKDPPSEKSDRKRSLRKLKRHLGSVHAGAKFDYRQRMSRREREVATAIASYLPTGLLKQLRECEGTRTSPRLPRVRGARALALRKSVV